MKACLLHAPAPVESNPLEFADVPAPRPGKGEVLVRVKACGVCRTDLHVVEGELPPRKSPVIPGHQIVGVVETLGEGARRFAVGARVGLPGCTRPIRPANTAAPGWKIFATIPHSPATPWTVDTPNTPWRRKTSSIRSRNRFPTNRPRLCCALGSSGFAACVFRASSAAGVSRSTVSERRRTWRFKWRATGA